MQLLNWLRRRVIPGAPVHVHDWFIGFRQEDPPVEVADCACGARARVYRSRHGLPEIRIEEPKPGGSVENCLIKDHESQLGDPQAESLLLLIS